MSPGTVPRSGLQRVSARRVHVQTPGRGRQVRAFRVSFATGAGVMGGTVPAAALITVLTLFPTGNGKIRPAF
jgi:hypothetical protein